VLWLCKLFHWISQETLHECSELVTTWTFYVLHFFNSILFLLCPFPPPKTFLELIGLIIVRGEKTLSTQILSCPPLTLFPAGFEVQSFGPICIWNVFYSYANKRIRFTGHSSCSHQTRRFLSPSLFLSLTPFCLRKVEEKRQRTGPSCSPAAFVWTERRRPAILKTIQSKRPSSTQNTSNQVSWSHLKWHQQWKL